HARALGMGARHPQQSSPLFPGVLRASAVERGDDRDAAVLRSAPDAGSARDDARVGRVRRRAAAVRHPAPAPATARAEPAYPLAAGAFATITYASTISLLPYRLFGMSIAAAELPELSRQRQGAKNVLRERVSAGLRELIVCVIPSFVAFILLGDIPVGALY